MIEFVNISNEPPYKKLKELYDYAIEAGQSSIEAISISSYSSIEKEVDSRYVNLKFVSNENLIFFTNYQSVKSLHIESHNQVSALLYWSSTNTQIRIKGHAEKTSKEFSDNYFKKRLDSKNALAISSSQSQSIDSYEEVIKNYEKTLKNTNLEKRPKYWGGFAIKPYYFEFWTGNVNRVNKREVYEKVKNDWKFYYLQP